VINNAAIVAVKQPFNLNLGTNLATISRHNPLTKKENKPNERNVMGNEMNISIGFIVTFTKARTKAVTIAVGKSSIPKRPVRRPTAKMEKDRINNCRIRSSISS